MFTHNEAKRFTQSYQRDVRFYSRKSAANLNIIYARKLREHGKEILFGGPSNRDDLLSAILELDGMGIDRINEASHVLYHDADMPNEACKFCN